MADFITLIGTVITWIFSCFSDLLTFITTDHPVVLFFVGLALLGTVTGIIFKLKGRLGLRSRRR